MEKQQQLCRKTRRHTIRGVQQPRIVTAMKIETFVSGIADDDISGDRRLDNLRPVGAGKKRSCDCLALPLFVDTLSILKTANANRIRRAARKGSDATGAIGIVGGLYDGDRT